MLLGLALALLTATAQAPQRILPEKWLVIAPVDERGRRPFRPDAVFGAHLLDPAAPPPAAGQQLTGEKAVAREWREVRAVDGVLEGEIGWAYTAVESDADRVVLAQLSGAWQLFVDGAGTTGDAYGYGFGGVPVVLRKGTSHLFVGGARGRARLELTAPAAPFLFGTWDVTAPDLVAGRETPSADYLALPLIHAALEPAKDLRIRYGGGFFEAGEQPTQSLVPPALRKQWLPLERAKRGKEDLAAEKPGPQSFAIALLSKDGAVLASAEIPIQLVAPDVARRFTFGSLIEGSVQGFAALPAACELDTARPKGMVVSLHGAGVDALAQARSYSQKSDFSIVAPTNRRPYGFDWQDWGRTDAYEVMREALDIPGVGSPITFLTGHSMGGHGTWHLAANDPARFIAIAPSAGWASFDSYGGRPQGALAELWRAADAASRTEDLIANLAPLTTFILHGTADDNVPCGDARALEQRLVAAGGKPRVHYQEGAGHWWDGDAAPGVDCVDWPGVFELFRAQDPDRVPETFELLVAEPSFTSKFHGIHLEQPIQYGKPMRLRGRISAARAKLELETENVRWLRFAPSPGRITHVRLDGQEVGTVATSNGIMGFLREQDAWRKTWDRFGVIASPADDRATDVILETPLLRKEKTAASGGPFKRAFDRHFALVYGTQGDARENRELFERARHDQQVWWYRANGTPQLIADRAFLKDQERVGKRVRNVILYGNADTNAAWSACVPADCPVRARRGELALGEKTWKGDDLGAVVVARRADGTPEVDGTLPLVAAFADTGIRGARLGYTLAPFVSGVGYPDYALFSSEILTLGDGGVLASGWFDHAWKLQPDGYVRSETATEER